MSDDDFNAAIDAIIGGVPITIVISRLTLLVRALVESGGAPAADLLRSVVQLRGRVDALDDDHAGVPGEDEEIGQ